MAGIKQPVIDILTLLETIQVTNGDGNIVTPHVRIWNNQTKYEINGTLYNFPKPAFFLEIINNVSYQEIGKGFQSADIGFRIHIVTEFYDAQNGTMEQDLVIFDLRDKIKATLSLFEPTAVGPLVCVSEKQDEEHTNIVEWLLDFVANFIDSKGSPLDTNAGKYVDSTPPADLDLTANLVDSIDGKDNQFVNNEFIIPQT